MADWLLLNRGDGSFDAQPVPAADGYSEPGIHVSEIIPAPHMAVADYNRDGALDLFLAGRHYYGWLDDARLQAGTPHRLLRNRGSGNNWLQFDLQGTQSNRDGIGARVRLLTDSGAQLRLHTGGTDSFDQHSKRLHFGLGKAAMAKQVEVIWPSGARSVLDNVAANQILAIREPLKK